MDKELAFWLPRQPVQSSNLAEVGYDPESGKLDIQFIGGRVYRYFGVPEEVYRELLNSASLGQFFSRNIRNVYRFMEIGSGGPVLETYQKIFQESDSSQ